MEKRRLLTKSDFDGVLCAAILKATSCIEEVVFVNSFDFENGEVAIESQDITCNLPYSDKVTLSFNYGKESKAENNITYLEKPSCSRIVYEYYLDKLSNIDEDRLEKLLDAVDKSNAASFSRDEILEPKSFDMLSFILDSRTGIGRVRAFKISNYALMIKLVDLLLEHDIEEIMDSEDLKERIEYYKDSQESYEEMLEFCAREEKKVLILDLREETYVRPANRFVKYAIYPDSKYAIQIMWGLRRKNTVFAVGKTIFDRNEDVDLENVLKKYGGIARQNSGSIQVKSEDADEILSALVTELNSL